MVGRRLVGGGSQHKSTETSPVLESQTNSVSCRAHFAELEASKPSSVSCLVMMANCEGIRGGPDESQKPDSETIDHSMVVLEPVLVQQLGENLGRLSIQFSKCETQEEKMDGDCSQAILPSETKGFSECARKASETLPAKDARNMEQRVYPKSSSNSKKRFFDRAKESRPPSLALLSQVSEEDYCHSHQGSIDTQFSRQGQLHVPEDQQLIRNGYCLPTSLVSSPHSIESRNLDPNAREFTPCYSCSASPGVHPQHGMPLAPVGYPLSIPPDFSQIAYNTDVCGPGFPVPPYANGGPVCFGAISNTWDGLPVGVGIPAGGNLLGCRPSGPPLIAHVGVLPMSLSNLPPTSGQFCCIPGIDSHNVPATDQPFPMPSPPNWKEHTSRSLLLTGVVVCVSEAQLRKDFECWGPVRALELERQQEGIVIVHFYDLRHARDSLKDIQSQHLLKQQQFQQQLHSLNSSPIIPDQADCYASDFSLDGKKLSDRKCRDGDFNSGRRGLIGGNVVWAQYTSFLSAAVPDAYNLGTLVVFNVDADVSIDELRAVFQKYGDVKELRETPSKRQHKFVEFYDVRDAAAAWSNLNGHEICGKAVKIEFSRPGGQARRARAQTHIEMSGVGVQLGACTIPANVRIHNHPAASFQPFGWNAESCTGSQNLAGNPVGFPAPLLWSHYPTGNGTTVTHPQWHRFPEGHPQPIAYPANACGTQNTSGQVMNGTPGSHLNKNTAAIPEFLPVSGSPRCNGHGPGGRLAINNGPRNGEVSVARKRRSGLCSGGTHLKMDVSNLPDADGDRRLASETGLVARESTFSGRTGLTPRNSPREAHAQYAFDEGEVHLNLATPRTTLMIRNIPNKYSQQMLLSLLDQHCLHCNSQIADSELQSAYDFVYLPIDFKNRCNLGYAFVNFTTALATLKFYKAFHEQAWEAFNSRKICQIAYARVQGRAALEEHFRNSRFACDTDEYLPLVFTPARSGIECPPPRVAAGQLNGKTHGVRVELCRSPSRNGYFQDHVAPGCSPRSEKGSFDGAGLGSATLASVAVEGVGA